MTSIPETSGHKRDSEAPLDKHRVVIIGGGVAGLELATRLGRSLGRRGRTAVTLIDPGTTHVWKPLLHQLAAGGLDPAEYAVEYLAQARKNHFRFRLGEVNGIDRIQRQVRVAATRNGAGEEIIPERSFGYDTLVIAVGSVTNDFGVPGVREHCLRLDNRHQAESFQRTLVEHLLRADAQRAPLEPGHLDVVIVGAGATGIELAAQLHQVTRQLAQYGFDVIDPERHMRICIVDGGQRILPALPERISEQVSAEMACLGIALHLGKRVSEVKAEGVCSSDGDFYPAAIKVWAAGIKGPDFIGRLDLERNTLNQIRVQSNLQVPGDERIYCLGDCAAAPMNGSDQTVPPRAQAAHQQASFLARQIRNRVAGRPTDAPYVYRDYGSLVTLGRYSTVGSLMGAIAGNVRVSGMVARLVYLSLYKTHQITLFGWWRTGMLTLANLLRRTVDPAIKLH